MRSTERKDNLDSIIGVDVGGTHTDLVLLDPTGGRIVPIKVPTTRHNLTVGILDGLDQLLDSVNEVNVSRMTLGTTAGTNAVIERRGAKTALITTEGFGDLLHIGRQQRPRLYDFFVDKTRPLLRRRDVFEVGERVLYDGTVVQEPEEEELSRLAEKLRAGGYESVAVCLLHSYAFDDHERRILKRLSEALPGVEFSLSSDVAPEIREYERCNTTVADAFIKPLLRRHFDELEAALRARRIPELFIMQSSGGLMKAQEARRSVVSTLNSGPAGGVAGGAYLAEHAGISDLITLDMGGTSADIAIVRDGRPAIRNEFELDPVPGAHHYLATGLPIKAPSVDVNPIGAGGGSIAWLDEGEILKVGPESAGSTPGPACYGRGGTRPTVTDAHAVLGRLGAERPLGGYLKLEPELAYEAIREHLAGPLGTSVEEVAQGIISVVNSNMVVGMRLASVYRGFDPRDFTLAAFGGAGALHAIELARELGMRRVLIPPHPGAVSALGLLAADVKHLSGRTLIKTVTPDTIGEIDRAYAALEKETLKLMRGHGLEADRVKLVRTAEARYVGQGYELPIWVDSFLGSAAAEDVVEAFHTVHEKQYGYRRPSERIEIVNLRLEAVGPMPKPSVPVLEGECTQDASAAVLGSRDLIVAGTCWTAEVYDRSRLKTGNRVQGPAVIEDLTSTVYLPPETEATVDALGNLLGWVGPERGGME